MSGSETENMSWMTGEWVGGKFDKWDRKSWNEWVKMVTCKTIQRNGFVSEMHIHIFILNVITCICFYLQILLATLENINTYMFRILCVCIYRHDKQIQIKDIKETCWFCIFKYCMKYLSQTVGVISV